MFKNPTPASGGAVRHTAQRPPRHSSAHEPHHRQKLASTRGYSSAAAASIDLTGEMGSTGGAAGSEQHSFNVHASSFSESGASSDEDGVHDWNGAAGVMEGGYDSDEDAGTAATPTEQLHGGIAAAGQKPARTRKCPRSVELMTKVQQEALWAQLNSFFVDDVLLYEQILQHDAIDFDEVWQRIKHSEISCNRRILQQYLDQSGVLYATPWRQQSNKRTKARAPG